MAQSIPANEKSYILKEVKAQPTQQQGATLFLLLSGYVTWTLGSLYNLGLCRSKNDRRSRLKKLSTQHGEGEASVSTDDRKQLVNLETGPGEAAENDGRSSLPYTSFNYINSIIGSGIIGMPYALRQSGFWFGLILMVVVAGITDYSLVLMVKGGNIAQSNSYQDLVSSAFGKPGFYILSVMQFAYPFIAMISYNVIIGDTTTKVLLRITNLSPNSILGNRHFIVALATLLITLPLSLYKQMSKLAKISFVSLLFIAFILVAIIIRLGTLGPEIPATSDAWRFADTGITQAIGIMTFAFMCHHNTFLIYGSLTNPTEERWNKVTHASLFVALVVSMILGIAGYATFTGQSQGDVLENYCLDDDLMNVARFFFGITIMLTYPIECFVTREVVENVMLSGEKAQNDLRHFLVTVVIVVLTVLVSMSTDCLGIVLELNGVLAAVPLAYIMPALCYMKLDEGPLLSRHKFPALLTALFGFVVMLSGLGMIIYSFSEYISCSHSEHMSYCTGGNGSLNAQTLLSETRNHLITTTFPPPNLAS